MTDDLVARHPPSPFTPSPLKDDRPRAASPRQHNMYERRDDRTWAVEGKWQICRGACDEPRSRSALAILLFFSHLPITLSLPRGRLIKTNAIVKYHGDAGAPRAAGSYFSFSLVWWCDFVFFRNRFVSNGSVYPATLFHCPLFPPVQGGWGWRTLGSSVWRLQSFTAVWFWSMNENNMLSGCQMRKE